jgi:hypothetical protein
MRTVPVPDTPSDLVAKSIYEPRLFAVDPFDPELIKAFLRDEEDVFPTSIHSMFPLLLVAAFLFTNCKTPMPLAASPLPTRVRYALPAKTLKPGVLVPIPTLPEESVTSVLAGALADKVMPLPARMGAVVAGSDSVKSEFVFGAAMVSVPVPLGLPWTLTLLI